MSAIEKVQAQTVKVEAARARVAVLEDQLKVARKEMEREQTALQRAHENAIREEVRAEERARAAEREAALKAAHAEKLAQEQAKHSEKVAALKATHADKLAAAKRGKPSVHNGDGSLPLPESAFTTVQQVVGKASKGVLAGDSDQTRALLLALDQARDKAGKGRGVGDLFEVRFGPSGATRIKFWVEETGLHFQRV